MTMAPLHEKSNEDFSPQLAQKQKLVLLRWNVHKFSNILWIFSELQALEVHKEGAGG